MKTRFLAAVTVALAVLIALPIQAADKATIELFGVSVKGASREKLRQAFKASRLPPTREDDRYWVDTYDAHAALEGASDLMVGYVGATATFAVAEYHFPSFMDTEQVGKVIDMVAMKYGRPSSKSGDSQLGPVTAKWTLGQGMRIEVSRGWPSTTTTLRYLDAAAYGQMRAEMDANARANERKKAQAQSGAF